MINYIDTIYILSLECIKVCVHFLFLASRATFSCKCFVACGAKCFILCWHLEVVSHLVVVVVVALTVHCKLFDCLNLHDILPCAECLRNVSSRP